MVYASFIGGVLKIECEDENIRKQWIEHFNYIKEYHEAYYINHNSINFHATFYTQYRMLRDMEQVIMIVR